MLGRAQHSISFSPRSPFNTHHPRTVASRPHQQHWPPPVISYSLPPPKAVATAADLATLHNGRVTVLVVDEQVSKPDAEPASAGAAADQQQEDSSKDQNKLQHQASKIANTLTQMGIQFQIVERTVVGSKAKDAEGQSSVVVGEWLVAGGMPAGFVPSLGACHLRSPVVATLQGCWMSW